MKNKLQELLRGYVLPAVLVGGTIALAVNVPIQAARARSAQVEQPEQPESEEASGLHQQLEEQFDFLREYSLKRGEYCNFGQQMFPDERFDDRVTRRLAKENGPKYFAMLQAKGYFPSSDALQKLERLCEGEGHDLVIKEGSNRWMLAYRTKDAPSPFQRGFTLIEPGSNQNIRNLFSGSFLASPNTFHYYLMDQQGVIDYLVSLNSTECAAMKPHQLIFRTWLREEPWEDLVLAQTQKRISRRLEEMAENLQSGSLYCGDNTPLAKQFFEEVTEL